MQTSGTSTSRLKPCVTSDVFDPKMSFEDRCRMAANFGCIDYARTIQDNFQWITGGVLGRHEIEGIQEPNYNFVTKTIADLSYTGYVTREYKLSTGRDALESLQQAIKS
jgi:hypothetical protein